MKTVLSANLVEQAAEMGDYLIAQLNALQVKYPEKIKEVRGVGLMIGIELTGPGAPVLNRCHELGLLANITAGTVLRLLPPYVITREDVDKAVGIIEQALTAL